MKVIFCSITIYALLGAPSLFAAGYTSIIDNCKNLTTAQYKIYSSEIEGEAINLEGEVIDVEERFFSSRYNVTVDTNGDSFFDVGFAIDEATAMSLKKGESYRITGDIKSIEKEFGECSVILDNVSID